LETVPETAVYQDSFNYERFVFSGEYQDYLSHFIEYKAIDMVRSYLDKCNINDGLLTFSALRLLASLLCHNKVSYDLKYCLLYICNDSVWYILILFLDNN